MLRGVGQKPSDVWPMVALLHNHPVACQPAAPAGKPLLAAFLTLILLLLRSDWKSCLLNLPSAAV